ncbi:hypothetical protein QUQ58_004626 [Escherichia coli]|nr:hypothetical protein [Escherichia coli]
MRRNVANLIISAMKEAGLSNAVDAELDDHSVITFNMKDDILPLHIINDENDNVWIWTELGEFSLNDLLYYSRDLIQIIINSDEGLFPLGQPCLYLEDGILYVRACFIDSNLESTSDFINCMDYFLKLVQSYRSVLA